MLDVGRTSPPLPTTTGPEVSVLSLVGTEADLGAVIVRLARMAAAVHMAEATATTAAPASARLAEERPA